MPRPTPLASPPSPPSLPVHSGDEADLRDGKELRRLALQFSIPIVTTVAGGLGWVWLARVCAAPWIQVTTAPHSASRRSHTAAPGLKAHGPGERTHPRGCV